MRFSYLIIILITTTTMLAGCQKFNDLFVFRTEQKHLVIPKSSDHLSLNKPQRLKPPLPLGEHYSVN